MGLFFLYSMNDVPVDPSSFSLFFFVFLLPSLFSCAWLSVRVQMCVWWQRKRGDRQPRSSSSSSSSQSHHLPTFPDPLACMQEHVAPFGLVLSAVLCCDILNCSVLCCAVPCYAMWEKQKSTFKSFVVTIAEIDTPALSLMGEDKFLTMG